jgi:hypothetical protein
MAGLIPKEAFLEQLQTRSKQWGLKPLNVEQKGL